MGAASAAYCAVSAGSKPIEEVPKVIPAWQDGAWKARYARENLRFEAAPYKYEVSSTYVVCLSALHFIGAARYSPLSVARPGLGTCLPPLAMSGEGRVGFGFHRNQRLKERERRERQKEERRRRDRELEVEKEMERQVKQRLTSGDLRETVVSRVLELLRTEAVEARIEQGAKDAIDKRRQDAAKELEAEREALVREAFVKEDARLSEAQRLQDILAENAKKVSAESKRRAEEERHVKRERQAELQLLSAERKRLGIAAAVTRK